jgi:osmoprotectant transport system permease protein
MGMTEGQLFRRVELPLALPEIVAGLRVATVSTIAIASLAVFVGGGGLGEEIVTGQNITFKTGVLTASAILIAMAITFDILWLVLQRLLTPWRTVDRGAARRGRFAGLAGRVQTS